MIAWLAGINAYEISLSILYPETLLTKPLLCLQSHILDIAQYITTCHNNDSHIVVYPAFLDRDFAYPFILIKVNHFTIIILYWYCDMMIVIVCVMCYDSISLFSLVD